MKPRNRAALKRMQSFPAPELKDRNHNHKIQKVLTLIQNIREEDPAPRPRRLSLPLPTSPTLQHANQARGSLQGFSTNNRSQTEDTITRNGMLKRPIMAELEVNVIVADNIPADNRERKKVSNKPKTDIIDVISAEPPIEALTDRRTVIDMEGLQCTRV